MLKRFIREEEGQTATEYMLLISVVVVSVVAFAFQFAPEFGNGAQGLAEGVSEAMTEGRLADGRVGVGL